MKGIDAARGIAMVLVCVSHVRVHFVDSAPGLYYFLTTVTRLATPTFLLLSGFVAAYVLASDRSKVRITVFDRGLFVLLIGHFLLNLNDLRYVEIAQWILGRVTITDAIGICLMCAVTVHRMPAAVLAAIGTLFALASWSIAMTLSVDSPALGHIGAALFNLRSEENALVDVAIVSYLGLFLIGMALSKHFLEDLRRERFDAVARRLAIYGIAAVAVVALGVLSWLTLKSMGLTPTDPLASDFARLSLDPRSKLPPSPAYLLFYGGGALLVAAVCLIARPRALMRPLVDWTSTLGRASLMCFVVQDWLLRLAPGILGFDSSTSILFWALYLVSAVLVIHWLASRWNAKGANRYLTLGLRNRVQTSATRVR